MNPTCTNAIESPTYSDSEAGTKMSEVDLSFEPGPSGRGFIAVIFFNRPNQHNAINPALGKAFSAALSSLRQVFIIRLHNPIFSFVLEESVVVLVCHTHSLAL